MSFTPTSLAYKIRRLTSSVILSLTLIFTSIPFYSSTASAESLVCDYAYHSANDILYYDPCAEACEVGSGSPTVFETATSPTPNPSPLTDTPLEKVVDYLNREILSSSDLEKIQQHKPFYIKAAEKVGIPWEMIAVIHYRETRLGRNNPANGQGIYQDYAKLGGPYPAGTNVSDEEFQRQTDFIADFILDKAGSKKDALKSGDDNAVKYTFFGYNGRASVYVDQAKKLGFTDEQARNGEGSPYVMNKADAVRDPGSNPTGWGQIKTDGGSIQYPANQDHGAFVIYAALRGKITSSTACSSPSGNVTLSEGGLTQEQAKQFVMNYGANKNNTTKDILMSSGNYWTGGGSYNYGSNCVSFTRFFLMKFTNTTISGSMGNGDDVVKNLAARGMPTGTEPKVYAVFSTPATSDNPYGHTGIVLGIQGDTIIVGHASYGRSADGVQGAGDGTSSGSGVAFIKVGTFSGNPNIWWDSGRPVTFAYPTTVDTKAIETYLTTGE